MSQTIGFIHTVLGLEERFSGLARELIPAATVFHISDESLIKAALAAGGLTPWLYRRICDHVVAAEEHGADVVQVTCSSVSPCVDVAKFLVSVPVLKVDQPMVEHAVSNYGCVGVIATAPTTLKPTTDLVRECARRLARSIEVKSVLCAEAYDAFFTGDLARHDRIVRDQLRDLMTAAEVVLLAQVSMARVAESLSAAERTVPVLSSPRLAMERLRDVLRGSADR